MQNASSAMKFRNQMFYGISQICHDLAGEVKLETEGKLIIDKRCQFHPSTKFRQLLGLLESKVICNILTPVT
ncbi:hypothetical protein Peur_045728 [Populus x canadensis]|jgi:hypothetical protein